MEAGRAERSFLPLEAATGLSVEALQVLATVPHWWRRKARQAGIRGPQADLSSAVLATPPVGLEQLSPLTIREDLLNVSAEALGNAYVIALDKAVRSSDGRHYTPQLLAESLQ